jgi:serine/threonine protein kinase
MIDPPLPHLPSAPSPQDEATGTLPGTPRPETATGGKPDEETGWNLGFLLPSSLPESLGRIGNYEVLGLVGRGGMGLVVKAFDPALERTVAIKVMHPNLAADEQNRRRFLREARTAAGINHPNVVTIHGADEQRGMPYLVMEFVDGVTLADRIRRGPPFDRGALMAVASQIAAGLAAAHQRGVIHRDIKPSNIMLVEGRDQVKVMDFGLALPGGEGTRLTGPGGILGTPSYMSPEQVCGEPIDRRSDLFGLGCVLYAMATGHSPFRGSHPLEIARKVQECAPAPVRDQAPQVSDEFAGVVGRLLARNPGNRFQSAEEVIHALSGRVPAISPPAPEHPRSAVPRRKLPWIAVGTLALLAPLALLFFLWRSSLPPPSGPPGHPANLLTVSRTGPADHATIKAALASAGPGATIRLLDDAVYTEAVQIDSAERWRGLTLEGERGPTLTAPEGALFAVGLKDTPGVTLRGLHIRSGARQHGLFIAGDGSGVSVEGVTCTHPDGAPFAGVYLTGGAHGLPQSPLRLKHCVVQGGELGVVLHDTAGGVVSCVRFEDCLFLGQGMHLVFSGKVEDVGVWGNRFAGGTGIGMNLAGPGPNRLQIGCNTFLGAAAWMKLDGTPRADQQVLVCNNLVLGAEGLEVPRGDVRGVAAAWSFRNNWWEPGAKTRVEEARTLAEIKAGVPLLSRDPADGDFLCPPPGSSLGVSGAGGDLPRHIGALPPARR